MSKLKKRYKEIISDPSFNVSTRFNLDAKRQDDLRIAHEKFGDEQIKHLKEIADIRDVHQRELRVTETGRLDSIRQVDQANAASTAIGLDGSLKTFAATAFTNAENLRNQLNSTATTMQKTTADLAVTLANQQAQRDEANNKRFTALEQQQYVGIGKDKVTDPIMEKYMGTLDAIVSKLAESKGKEVISEPIATQALVDIKTLLSTRSENTGKKLGMGEVIAYILAAIAIGGFVGTYL